MQDKNSVNRESEILYKFSHIDLKMPDVRLVISPAEKFKLNYCLGNDIVATRTHDDKTLNVS